MPETGKLIYDVPQCSTVLLQHRELIAASLNYVILFTSEDSNVPVDIENLTYEGL